MQIETIKLLPWIPAIGAALCGLCCMGASVRKLAGPICVLSIASSFALAVACYFGWDSATAVVTAIDWITVNQFSVGFSYYIDGLTMAMLFVVTGIGSLIALYATGYMHGDRGYARFFAGVSLFIFAMTTLVMADNLVLLFLGWEGVGLCSYLLIGYYYDKPFAVNAAKKAFIVNRIGDLGFALGIFLTWHTFGSVAFADIIPAAQQLLGHPPQGGIVDGAYAAYQHALPYYNDTTLIHWIPFLLMLGAFGKSAQIPLYVWLPDAMAGPTPVSALVHAATMVTSGVYMIARVLPMFQLSPWALPTVAIIGGATALFAATIALCNNDLKGVFAYSTVSQLGYMFLGIGAASTFGGVFHLMTHAFFKALLFLTAGSVMHALAGQLDIRTMSGLRHRMPVTCWLMFVGCLALAGFPLTSGFVSKDTILHDALAQGGPIYTTLAILGLLTALLTAFYTFRLWFKVFMGPEKFEMGDDHHSDDHGHDDHGHHAAPHEMPFWPMNLPLMLLAVGALLGGVLFKDPMTSWIENSSAASKALHPDGLISSLTLHSEMMILSGLIALVGIGAAAYFHWFRRDVTNKLAEQFAPVVKVLVNKYYIDELYDAVIVRPLRQTGRIFNAIDDYIFQGFFVELLGGGVPKLAGYLVRPTQHGKLQGYGVGMACGVVIIAIFVFYNLT